MVYLKSFEFPDDGTEFDFLLEVKRTCYTSFYPFKILSRRHFERIDFEPITMLYGGNGSGKSTALHVIAARAGVKCDARFLSLIHISEPTRLLSISYAVF